MTTINRDFVGCFGRPKSHIKPTAIIIHHTCTSSPKRTREALKRQGLSTHFEVDKDGTIYQYSEMDSLCYHCGSSNFTAIGIDVTHAKDAPWPEEQVEAVRWLVEYVCKECDIKHYVQTRLEGIYPHKAIGQTACPQDFPMERL